MSNQDVMTQFSKAELIEIANELGIDADGVRALELVELIRDDIRENDLPAEEDTSDLMEDFLYVAGYIDEDGDIIVGEPEGGKLGAQVVKFEGFTEDHVVTITDTGDGVTVLADGFIIAGEEVSKPPCFSFADERDPACRRCKVLEYCKAERIKSRPKCFGLLYKATDEHCIKCLEAINCKAVVEAAKSKENV